MSSPNRPIFDQIVRATQALALDAAGQVRAFPAFVLVPDELALNFFDAFLLVDAVLDKEWLTSEQVAALAAIDEELRNLTASGDAEIWCLEALQESKAWREVRTRARMALATLGASADSDLDSGIRYIEGNSA